MSPSAMVGAVEDNNVTHVAKRCFSYIGGRELGFLMIGAKQGARTRFGCMQPRPKTKPRQCLFAARPT